MFKQLQSDFAVKFRQALFGPVRRVYEAAGQGRNTAAHLLGAGAAAIRREPFIPTINYQIFGRPLSPLTALFRLTNPITVYYP